MESIDCGWVVQRRVPVVAAAPHSGAVRAVIVGAKRAGHPDHVAVMAGLARLSLEFVVGTTEGDVPISVVPIRSGARTRRSAGQDLVSAVLELAIRGMHGRGQRIHIADILQVRPTAINQKLLNREERHLNMRDRFRVRSDLIDRSRPTFVFDDVITTGATLTAAAIALRGAGLRVDGAAVVAHRAALFSSPRGQAGE